MDQVLVRIYWPLEGTVHNHSQYKLVYTTHVPQADYLDILKKLSLMIEMGTLRGYPGKTLKIDDAVRLNNKAYLCKEVGWIEIEWPRSA